MEPLTEAQKQLYDWLAEYIRTTALSFNSANDAGNES